MNWIEKAAMELQLRYADETPIQELAEVIHRHLAEAGGERCNECKEDSKCTVCGMLRSESPWGKKWDYNSSPYVGQSGWVHYCSPDEDAPVRRPNPSKTFVKHCDRCAARMARGAELERENAALRADNDSWRQKILYLQECLDKAKAERNALREALGALLESDVEYDHPAMDYLIALVDRKAWAAAKALEGKR